MLPKPGAVVRTRDIPLSSIDVADNHIEFTFADGFVATHRHCADNTLRTYTVKQRSYKEFEIEVANLQAS